jgi:toxin ParE1/3/4
MRSLQVSDRARADIRDIVLFSREQFGEKAAVRYSALIEQAILDLREDVFHAGTHRVPEVGQNIYVYRLSSSRRNVRRSLGRVKYPRHLVVLRVMRDDSIEIIRLLHESMELPPDLPAADFPK